MVTDFQEQLRQIRAAKDRESQAERARKSATEKNRTSDIELRINHRECLEQIIQEHGEMFMAEVPVFTLSKSFFEGKYKIEVRCDDLLIDDEGQLGKYFSRITFLIDPGHSPDAVADTLHVMCKKTVRNRDQDSDSMLVDTSEATTERFGQFVKKQFFDFASVYFAARHKAATH